MRQSTSVGSIIFATIVGVAAAGAVVRAGDRSPSNADDYAPAPIIAPTGIAAESGPPPQDLRLRAVVSRAWDDAIVTWKGLIRARAMEIGAVNLRFVERLSPMNCYGLYAGEGPVYCSGNLTVFIGTEATDRLMVKLGMHGGAGITFLVGHEIGHHIQNLHGRFRFLKSVLRSSPDNTFDAIRRFELEADCLAGVWIRASKAWSKSRRFRLDLMAALKTIGEGSVGGRSVGVRSDQDAVHGTSEQRTHWFMRGLKSGDMRACNTFRTPSL
ncbi:MAG: neutral zinc metallopeptidase [Hyphomicrobium sp.]